MPAKNLSSNSAKKLPMDEESVPLESGPLSDPIPSPKSKKDFDIIEPDEPVAEKIIEEETEETVAAAEDELAEEEVTLDDEELNPFGDKWEE